MIMKKKKRRTTLTLDDYIHAFARRSAFETGKSMGDLVSEWATKGCEIAGDLRPKSKANIPKV